MFKKFLNIKIMVIIIAFLFSGCGLNQKLSREMNLHPELVKRGEEFPGSKKCGDCHIDIYNEWAASMHAKSYISEEFKISTNDYEFKFCLGCHVPETIFKSDMADSSIKEFAEDEIKPRAHNLKDGVDCRSCHLTMDCTIAGPHSGIGPHPIEKKEELYRRSDFCGRCHIQTFKEYSMYAENDQEKTCQDCHMPAVKRKLIQDNPFQILHIRKEGKAHTFSSSDAMKSNEGFIELSFADLKSENNKIKGILRIMNTMVSHSIPTGKYGYREVLLKINIKNNLGEIIKSKQESMFVEMGTQLKPKEKRIYPFEFDIDYKKSEIKELEAVVFRTDFNRVNKTLLAKVEIKLNPPRKNTEYH